MMFIMELFLWNERFSVNSFFTKSAYHATDRHLKPASNESLPRCLMTHFAIYCYNMLPGAMIDKWSY